MSALFDTNILIDFLNGVPEAREELLQYEAKVISIITWIEVMVGAGEDVIGPTLSFLTTFEVIGLDQGVAETAVLIRRRYRMKLPDAIVWASARRNDLLIVTRNTKDFPAGDPTIRIPYTL